MADERPEPAGKQTAKARDAGRPTRASGRAAKARRDKPNLDERNERMVGPRKPMGPPLEESTAKGRRAERASRVKPTDPEVPLSRGTGAASKSARSAKGRAATRKTSRKTKKTSRRRG